MAVTNREMELMEENRRLKEENEKLKYQLMHETKEKLLAKQEAIYANIKAKLGGTQWTKLI